MCVSILIEMAQKFSHKGEEMKINLASGPIGTDTNNRNVESV